MQVDTSDLYNRIFEDYAEKFSDPSDHIDDFLIELPENGKVLDVGCGPGVDVAYMNDKGFDVTGVDFSVGMIASAKKHYPGLNFLQGDLRDIQYDDAVFDGILASYSLIHLKEGEVLAVLQNLHRLLKENGVLCVGFQEGESTEAWLKEPFDPTVEFFLKVYSCDEMMGFIEKAGFSILKEFKRLPECEEELGYTKMCIVAKRV